MENAFRNLQKMVQSVSGQDDLLGLECPACTGMALKLLLLLLAGATGPPGSSAGHGSGGAKEGLQLPG